MSNQFDTADYLNYAGLNQCMARVTFPAPFTIGDYRTWFRAMNLADMPDETDDVDQVTLMRQYRGAMAVATVEPYTPDECNAFAVETAVSTLPLEPDEWRYTTIDPEAEPQKPLDMAVVDPAYDDLPMAWVSFMVQAAEQYIGDRIITGVVGDRLSPQQRLDVMKRRMSSNHRLPSFNHDYVAALLPAIAMHRGFVTFREPLTKSWYRRWVKETAVNKNVPVTDVNNGRFMRSLRGAVTLVQQFHFRNLAWTELTAKDCDAMPLEIACFLVETCDEYMSRRMTVKN